MRKIRKILIANRGEIAVRVINAAKELNLTTICIYSEIDRKALHVLRSDEAYYIENRGIEPYLDMDQILTIAEQSEADAIHPGYGFLSENHVFAREAIFRGFIFIGPPPESIAMMGDKLRAKAIAEQAGVPVIPGFEIEGSLNNEHKENARQIGFPVLIKARAGGGGKGMRKVNAIEDFDLQVELAIREAQDAFGDGRVFVERLIEQPRHIEIQVLADEHGNAVHIFERECSIQRRHQKLIEEAPSVVLDDNLRASMGAAAVNLVHQSQYTNAGTVEFIMDQEKNFYFLEMNTRLQVEHPITEYISGLDLVKLQIAIAEHQRLPFTQDDLRIRGHAIELRICAEDPNNTFLPDTGNLKKYRQALGPGVRVDDGYAEGMDVPVQYDPLLSKLIAFGKDRNEAIARLKRAIDDFDIIGVKNTLEFGKFVLEDEDFCNGDYHTGFIDLKFVGNQILNKTEEEAMIASVVGVELLSGGAPDPVHEVRNDSSKWRARLKK